MYPLVIITYTLMYIILMSFCFKPLEDHIKKPINYFQALKKRKSTHYREVKNTAGLSVRIRTNSERLKEKERERERDHFLCVWILFQSCHVAVCTLQEF